MTELKIFIMKSKVIILLQICCNEGSERKESMLGANAVNVIIKWQQEAAKNPSHPLAVLATPSPTTWPISSLGTSTGYGSG